MMKISRIVIGQYQQQALIGALLALIFTRPVDGVSGW